MENNKMRKLIFWVISFILFLPIIVLPPQFQPSVWSRSILFRISLTFLASFIFYRYFIKKDASISVPQKGSPFYKFVIVFLIFLGLTALSVLSSQNIMFSFFSSPVRAGGFLNLLFFFIFSVVLSIFVNEKDWNKLFKVLFASGIIISLLGVIQYFNFFSNIFLGAEKNITSFLGNSTFLAIYMMFLSLLALNFFLQETDKKKKMIYAGLLGLFLFIILTTSARATYLGILVAFLYFLFFYPVKKERYLKKIKIVTAVVLTLSAAFIIYVNTVQKLPDFVENNPRLSYILKNRLSVEIVARDLFKTRLSAWKTTMSAIKEKPLLGWGPENFYIGFEKYYDPIIFASKEDSWWDRPHNIFIEVAVNSGIPACIFYIALWVVLFWQLQKNKYKKSEQSDKEYEIKQRTIHALQAMFIGYLFALFFNFDSFATYLISYFFIGYSLYLISKSENKKEIFPKENNFWSKKPVAVCMLIIVFAFVWFWNIKPLYFAEKIAYANNLSRIGSCNKALSLAENIWEKSKIINAYLGLKYTEVVRACASSEDEITLSENSLSALKTSAEIQPEYTRTWILMGSFTDILAAREQNKEKQSNLLAEAREYLKKAQELSPKRLEALVELEKNYLIAENYQAANNTAQDCIKIAPSQGICYWYLGVSEIFLGDQENGKKHIKESEEKGYEDPILLQLAVAYLSQKNYADAAKIYDRLTDRYNNNPSYHAVAAALAKELGDYRKAAYEALQVFRTRPKTPENIQENVQFIEILFRAKSSDPILRASLAYIYREVGIEQKNIDLVRNSEAIYLQLTKEYPNEYDYHFGLAKTYKVLDKYIQAREEAIIAATLNNTDQDYKREIQLFLNDLPLKADQKILPQ